MRYLVGLASMTMALSGAGPACAQSEGMMRISNPNVVETGLKDLGAQIVRREDKGEKVRLGVKLEGQVFAISFYGCTGNSSCNSLQFLTYWKKDESLTLERANAWNEATRYLRIAIDSSGDAIGSMDFPAGTVSADYFADMVAIWTAATEAFVTFKQKAR